MTVAGLAFVGLGGFTPVQAWNSCLEYRIRSPPGSGSVLAPPDSRGHRHCPVLLGMSWPVPTAKILLWVQARAPGMCWALETKSQPFLQCSLFCLQATLGGPETPRTSAGRSTPAQVMVALTSTGGTGLVPRTAKVCTWLQLRRKNTVQY